MNNRVSGCDNKLIINQKSLILENIIFLHLTFLGMADAGDNEAVAALIISSFLIVTLMAWVTGIGAGNDFGGSIGCGCCSSVILIVIFGVVGIVK